MRPISWMWNEPKKSPSARNDILAKRFNLPMEGYTFFFPYEETLCHRPRSYWQMPCAMGADLSMGDDFFVRLRFCFRFQADILG